MLVTLLDATGQEHFVTWQGQDQINDGSGNLGAEAVGDNAAPQQILPANQLRAGWLFQNTSINPMKVFEAGSNVAGWVVNPWQFFPPNNYPVPVGALYVQGTAASQQGDTFTLREWVNAINE